MTDTTVAFDLAGAQALATTAATEAQQKNALTAIAINSPELAQWAIDEAKRVRVLKQKLEAERDKGTKPLLGVVDIIRGWFRDPIAVLDQVYTYLTSAATAYHAIERVRAAAALTEATSQVEVRAATEAMVAKPTGTKQVTYYSMRVIKASDVPDAYWVVDESTLKALARAQKENFSVPGCELVRDTRMVPM